MTYMLRHMMNRKGISTHGGTVLSGIAEGAIATLLTLSLTTAEAAAQQQDIAPELVARMAQEKQARRACKVEICTAFAKPAPGAPITCDVTQTLTQQEIVARILGGSYVWGYGHVQCKVKVSLDRSLIAKVMTEAKTIMSPPEHAFICDVEDKEPAKGKAFSVKVMVTPAVTFEDGNAKSVAYEPVKTEGSTVASAAVASLVTVDKVSGFVSRAAVAEINKFLYEKCKEEGVEIARK